MEHVVNRYYIARTEQQRSAAAHIRPGKRIRMFKYFSLCVIYCNYDLILPHPYWPLCLSSYTVWQFVLFGWGLNGKVLHRDKIIFSLQFWAHIWKIYANVDLTRRIYICYAQRMQYILTIIHCQCSDSVVCLYFIYFIIFGLFLKINVQ